MLLKGEAQGSNECEGVGENMRKGERESRNSDCDRKEWRLGGEASKSITSVS
jgi:hypothetical protein